jgi:hypothetical protein
MDPRKSKQTGQDMASQWEDKVWLHCKGLTHSTPCSQTKILHKPKSTSLNQLR